MRAAVLRATILSFGLSAAAAGNVRAASYDCDGLAADMSPSEVGRVYYLNGDAGGWLPLGPDVAFRPNTLARFVYVTRETLEGARSGTLVIKTGRTLSGDDPLTRSPATVALHRPRSEVDEANCAVGSNADSLEASVSTPAYDRYHETNVRVADDGERTTLDTFHIRYTARRRQCRNTNDTNWDSYLPPDFRNNRSQFSFDPGIVAEGAPLQFVQAFQDQRAVGAGRRLFDQNVTIRRYQAPPGRAACVAFEQRVLGKKFFLRINDLEARTMSLFGLRRVGELSFLLSQ